MNNCIFVSMRKVIALFLLAFASTLTLQAQDLLVMASGDTLTGTVDVLFPDKYYEEITFDDGESKRRLKAYEFVGFVKGDDIFKSLKNGTKYQIMRLKKPGYLSLYEYRIDEAYNYSGLFASLKDGNGTDVPNMNFKKVMSKFLSDCNAVSLGVKEGEYKRKNIDELVDDYNACISQNTIESRSGKSTTIMTTEAAALAIEANDILTEAQSLDQDQLTSMLEDVIEKIREGEEVPAYLKKALEDQVSEDNPLYDKITNFLKKI